MSLISPKYKTMNLMQISSVTGIDIWIGLTTLAVAVVGIFIKILQMNVATKIKINENSLRITSVETQTNLSILALQKELLELKINVNNQMKDLRDLTTSSFNSFKLDNKEEHKELFEKLETMLNTLTEVSVSFKIHSQNSGKQYTSTKRGARQD